MRTTEEFPQNFIDKVHDYLKRNQKRYGGKYQDYFIAIPPKNTAGLGPYEDTPRSFQSICSVAGKMCGLLSFTYSNDTLPVLLDAVKDAYEKCTPDDQKTISKLFGNKTTENITEDDLLEIGLYDKVDNQSRSLGKLLLRHENLKTIYAGEHQRIHRQEDSLPDHIHHWVIVENERSEFNKELLLQSELCTKKYEIKTAKPSPVKIWVITESKKEDIPDSEKYFLSQLEKTLRAYFDGRNNVFYRAFGKKSDASTRLYNALFDTIIKEGEDTSKKINTIIIELKYELALIQKLPPDEQLNTRRLINMLTEAGFMCPDVLSSTPKVENLGSAAAAASRPN